MEIPSLFELSLQAVGSLGEQVAAVYPKGCKRFLDILTKSVKCEKNFKMLVDILNHYALIDENCILMTKSQALFELIISHTRGHILLPLGHVSEKSKKQRSKKLITLEEEEESENQVKYHHETSCVVEMYRLIHRILSRRIQDLYNNPKNSTSFVDNALTQLSSNCDIFTYLLLDLDYFRIAARSANDGGNFYYNYLSQVDISLSIFSLRKKYFKLALPRFNLKERIFPALVTINKLMNDGVNFSILLTIGGGILVLFDLYDRRLSEKKSKLFWLEILKLDINFPEFCVTIGEDSMSSSSYDTYARNGVIYCLDAMNQLGKLDEDQKTFLIDIVNVHHEQITKLKQERKQREKDGY